MPFLYRQRTKDSTEQIRLPNVCKCWPLGILLSQLDPTWSTGSRCKPSENFARRVSTPTRLPSASGSFGRGAQEAKRQLPPHNDMKGGMRGLGRMCRPCCRLEPMRICSKRQLPPPLSRCAKRSTPTAPARSARARTGHSAQEDCIAARARARDATGAQIATDLFVP